MIQTTHPPWRTTSMQEGEDDEDVNTSATIISSIEILGSSHDHEHNN
jgi:hypothetical protein